MNRLLAAVGLAVIVAASGLYAQRPAFEPITDKTLLNPSPDDWLMYSRTYDAQRFSPLAQITRANVGQLKEVFKLEFPSGQQGGQQESIPLVYKGVMYVFVPPRTIRAIDATTGTTIWEHARPSGASQ